MKFRVWAPRAKSVDLVLGDRHLSMDSDGDGHFTLEADATAPADYAFSLDGGRPLPDPRSRFQPNGVHAPSRLVKSDGFAWSDAGFQAPPLGAAVIYELHPGTFTREGTLDSAVRKLDHLVELGVTHVELMPVAEFPGARGWGYDGVDLFSVRASYGGPAALKRFVDACHGRGLAVLLDVVYNHLGPSGNYLGQFGPYFSGRYHSPWGETVNLDDADSDEVRRFLIDNALGWMSEFHVDGLRLDAVHALFDQSAKHFLEELAEETRALEARVGRRLSLIAESDLNDPRLVRSASAGGFGLDGMWVDDVHHALHTLLTGERTGYYSDFGSIAALAKALERGLVYDGVHSSHRRRRHGRAASDLRGSKLVAFIQNHDQVGNRALGERLHQQSSIERAKLGAAVLLCSPFVPLLFQGEEWAASARFPYFTDHQEPELAAAVSAGRRREFEAFGWSSDQIPDPQAPETFELARLDWDELATSPHREVLDFYRQLMGARREIADLSDDRLERTTVTYDEASRWLVMRRGSAVLVTNFGERETLVPTPVAGLRLVLSTPSDPTPSGGGVALGPWAAALFVPSG